MFLFAHRIRAPGVWECLGVQWLHGMQRMGQVK
jgi:hypothetical protein